MSNGSIAVTSKFSSDQNIHSEGVPKEICKNIYRMKLHELSQLPERDIQSFFSIKRQKTKRSNRNQNHKNRKECHEHCTIFHCIALLHTKPAFTTFQDKSCMHLNPKNHVHVKCIDFSVYTNFPYLMSNLLSLG